ncbi:pleckstrin homology domain-containing family A member 8 [Aplysia californica]|uniref:Pleckstrin homology domain-containing family A member 8 n=1 Tax=Aplysia californica TaxID=6500 RepID=A0ABM0JS91_APLCA|nr:pleckstrin homology domain-containing family A member 8 [Aplysia californica]
MEGVLWKWTNYLSGWQPRWFILDNGVLSYYKSQEDVNNGCKGSIKMTVCDIVVHPADMTRLDLIIPGEQHYYVKASTPQDRQSWLIALGSSKASFSETSAARKDADAMPDLVRTKKSELRLYCDLLMQQVHSVKEAAKVTDGKVDTEKLTESTSLIGATCDTFITTLEDCMKLLANTPMFESPHQHVRDAAIPPSPTRANAQRLPGTRSTITRPIPSEKMSRGRQTTSNGSPDGIKVHSSSSFNGIPVNKDTPPLSPLPVGVQQSSQNSSPSPSSSSAMTSKGSSAPLPVGVTATNATPTKSSEAPLSSEVLSSSSVVNGLSAPPEKSGELTVGDGQGLASPSVLSAAASSEDLAGEDFKDAIDGTISTFFSTMPSNFSHIDTSQASGILVNPFLDACRNLALIFDKLNGTAFAPVKMDFTGNIRKINQKYSSDPETFTTLQSMVLQEVQAQQHTHSNSATSALLWLKRSLEFIREFLRECSSGSTDLSVCASNAYSRTLKNYHGWVVRGVFAVAVKAIPYREDFITHLAADESVDVTSRQFEHVLMSDIEEFVSHLDRVLCVISDFYIEHNLDSKDTV